MSDPVTDSIKYMDRLEREGSALAVKRAEHIESALSDVDEMTELLRDYCEIIAPHILLTIKTSDTANIRNLHSVLRACAMRDAMNIYTLPEDLE